MIFHIAKELRFSHPIHWYVVLFRSVITGQLELWIREMNIQQAEINSNVTLAQRHFKTMLPRMGIACNTMKWAKSTRRVFMCSVGVCSQAKNMATFGVALHGWMQNAIWALGKWRRRITNIISLLSFFN